MTAWLLDALIAATLILTALSVLVSRSLFRSVVMFIAFGMLMALAWVRCPVLATALAGGASGRCTFLDAKGLPDSGTAVSHWSGACDRSGSGLSSEKQNFSFYEFAARPVCDSGGTSAEARADGRRYVDTVTGTGESPALKDQGSLHQRRRFHQRYHGKAWHQPKLVC